MYKYIFLFFILVTNFLFPITIHAIGSGDNVPTYEAKIVKIIEEKQIELMGSSQLYQKLELQIVSNNKTIVVENGN